MITFERINMHSSPTHFNFSIRLITIKFIIILKQLLYYQYIKLKQRVVNVLKFEKYQIQGLIIIISIQLQ